MPRSHEVPNTSADPNELDHLRNRIRLYLQVMLIIDLVAHVSDWVTPLLIEGLSPPSYPLPTAALRYGVTPLVAVAWALAKFRRPGRRALIALELGVTIGLSLVYVHIADATLTDEDRGYAAVFAMYGIVLLLSVRAALVPSPVVRTVVVGIVAVGSLYVLGHGTFDGLAPSVLDGVNFIGGAMVLVTGVTSHVIYGLRREIRQARQLGQYTVEEKLGEGGMGAVYRARHAMLRREAAIKLIKPGLESDGASRSRVLERFEREAHVTASLKSPHTVELYDFGVSSQGAFYYVMELLDGIDLESAVRKYGPLAPDRVAFLLRQVCDSLEEAHAVGLVHRDIKPANLFICRHGLHFDFVKVLDFGLVALGTGLQKDDEKLTREGFAGGTPAYIAPEMVATPDSVDGRADIYALGCVAYWMLTGHPPFVRDGSMATILAHVNDPPLPPSQVSEVAVPAALDTLVLACLAKKPDERPTTARALSQRLAEFYDPEKWNEDLAANWWKTHAPSRTPSSHADEHGATVLVTKKL
ncbi:MAG: serine/threonine protein kinase [Candidatus Eisenbacteria bacterium]|uniref:Serine/threonine protein kinase n=1 Tax=Eiseniibacteriota bacterium TaxID=2212470 RepID=A0A956NEQ6_UNCEI|nr:serine/threonine protein kinase [Candidatus Eisenbacteria bacterium]MCB9462854.1 serine/threonine protein kinase [Candidatus Eisenbacteria bacterium]